MQKKKLLGIIPMLLLLFLTSCGSTKSAENKTIILTSQMARMPEIVKALNEVIEPGYTVKLKQVNDNIQYNELVNAKEADVSFAQHEPFMEKFNQEKNGSLVMVEKIYHVEVGFYSKNYKKIAEIPVGSKVALPNDVTNEGRALAILAEQGLIQLKQGVGFNGTIKDITANPKKLTWLSVELANLAEAYQEKDVSLVFNYPTYIAKVGLTPKDAMFLEKNNDDRFAIGLVTHVDNKNSAKIKALKKAMKTDKIRQFLIQKEKVQPLF